MPPYTRRKFIGSAIFATAGAALLRAADEPPPWQIGCYTRPWADHDYRVGLDAIAGAGFGFAGLMTAKGGDLIKPDTPPERVAEIGTEAKSRGLRLSSVWGGNFIGKPSLADSIARLTRLIDSAALCGSSGLLLGGTGKPEQVDDYYKAVAECCDYAAAKGVGLSVKPHGGANSTGRQCRQLIEKVGHRNFGLWYDPGNIFYYSGGKIDPVDDAAAVDGLVVGMSIKDFRDPKDVNLTPGTGRVNFRGVLARLRRGGFISGPLIVECLTPGDLPHLKAEAAKAREFVAALAGN
ncbi:MAG: sugar phosphate isomerase/epimerase family protein [Opitutus sp.]